MKECDFSVNDSLENLIQKITEYKKNHKNAKDVSKDVSKEYKKAVKILKKAYIYVHRLGVFENGIDNIEKAYFQIHLATEIVIGERHVE